MYFLLCNDHLAKFNVLRAETCKIRNKQWSIFSSNSNFQDCNQRIFVKCIIALYFMMKKQSTHKQKRRICVPKCKSTCIDVDVACGLSHWHLAVWAKIISKFTNEISFNVSLFLHHHMDEDTQCVQFDWTHLILEYIIQFCLYTSFLFCEKYSDCANAYHINIYQHLIPSPLPLPFGRWNGFSQLYYVNFQCCRMQWV